MSDTSPQENFGGGVLKLFGFELKRIQKSKDNKNALPSVVPPVDDDGAGYNITAGAHFGQYLNIDGQEAKNNSQQIFKYRGASMHPEVDEAIDNIVNETITSVEDKSPVDLQLDNVEVSNDVKKKMTDEFDNIVSMLRFKELGYDIFKRWYVDGRIYHHLVVEKGREKAGIVDIRPIDAAKIRKVKEVKSKRDPKTGVKIIEGVNEYFIYQERPGMHSTSGVKLTYDSISYITSGLLDSERKRVISYLHKALKSINQLRMMEDSLVIYRLARAPERRIFYIDVGNLPKGKADQYVKDLQTKFRNKIVYDVNTGNLKDDRKHMSMLEDFWLPRKEGGRGTEITTLPGGENLGQIDDIVYFQRKMYKSLNIPITRLEADNAFGLGRSNEISRDELKFQKFIDRLRARFSTLFLEILKKQLILKQIIDPTEADDLFKNITVSYQRDNYFAELKESEIWRERFQSLEQVDGYVGKYISKKWVMKNILHRTDDQIEEMEKEIVDETPQESINGETNND